MVQKQNTQAILLRQSNQQGLFFWNKDHMFFALKMRLAVKSIQSLLSLRRLSVSIHRVLNNLLVFGKNVKRLQAAYKLRTSDSKLQWTP